MYTQVGKKNREMTRKKEQKAEREVYMAAFPI